MSATNEAPFFAFDNAYWDYHNFDDSCPSGIPSFFNLRTRIPKGERKWLREKALSIIKEHILLVGTVCEDYIPLESSFNGLKYAPGTVVRVFRELFGKERSFPHFRWKDPQYKLGIFVGVLVYSKAIEENEGRFLLLYPEELARSNYWKGVTTPIPSQFTVGEVDHIKSKPNLRDLREFNTLSRINTVEVVHKGMGILAYEVEKELATNQALQPA